MNRLRAAAALLMLAAPVAAAEPVRIAVVIGNAAYAHLPPLPACETSARLVATALRRGGYTVNQLANPTNARMGAALSALADEAAAAPGARVVAYVCGYVSALGARLFLLPVEASIAREEEVLSQGIVARLPVAAVATPGVGAGLFLADARLRPGITATPAFDLARPGDAPRAGYAVALSTSDAPGSAPLAAALSEAAAAGTLEAGALLAELGATPRRGTTVTAARPNEPAWIVGDAAPLVPPVPAPVPVPTTPTPTPTRPTPTPPAPAIGPPATDDAPATINPADRRRVQLELQRLGYFRGRVTGQFGWDTTNAIRQFQKELDAPVTGTLTTSQTNRLLLPR